MNTKILMLVSAIYLGISGLGFTFLPGELATSLHLGNSQLNFILLQIIGALYLGFAMLNWRTRHHLIGGIYRPPLVIGNLLHFMVSSFALTKIAVRPKVFLEVTRSLTVIYIIFALGFGDVLISNPVINKTA